MVKPGLLGPKQVKRPAPALQQWQKLLVSLGLLGSVGAEPSWPRANGTGSAAATAAVKSAGDARPPGIVKQSATKKPELAESSGGAGPPWSRANGNSAADSAVAFCW